MRTISSFPSDYPEEWVVSGGRSWSEQYILQAFLAFNDTFAIFGVGIAKLLSPTTVRRSLAIEIPKWKLLDATQAGRGHVRSG